MQMFSATATKPTIPTTVGNSVKKVNAIEIKRRLYDLCTLGPEALDKDLGSTEETEAWHEFILQIAIHSLDSHSDASSMPFVTTSLGGVCLCDAGDNKILIKVDGETPLTFDISLDELQEKIRVAVSTKDDGYFGAAHSQSVNGVKVRVAFDDIADGLRYDINSLGFSPERAASFDQHCVLIHEALIPVLTEKRSNFICINLPNGSQITLTEIESHVILALGDHKVTLESITLEKLLENLHFENKSRGLNPDIALQKFRFRELGWQGAIYNKTNKSWLSPPTVESNPKSQGYMTLVENFLAGNLNGQTFFAAATPSDPTKKKIFCRHLAFQFIKDSLEDKSGQGKIDWTPYRTKESINKHIPMETEAAYSALIGNAKRYDLVNNDKIGEYIQACFVEMVSNPENKQTVRTLLIESTNHAMAIRLRIKGTEEKPVYVVSFYDPNTTNATMRCETDDLSTFTSHTLEHYITGSTSLLNSNYHDYYDGNAPVSLVMECNLASFLPNPTPHAKKLTSFTPVPLTSTHLFFLLHGNFFTDLAQLKGQLYEIGCTAPKELLNLLAAKGMKGTPGLWMALQEGHKEAIEVFGALLQLVPENERAALVGLLIANNAKGTPGLWMALQEGHAKAIQAYGALLQLIPANERAVLVDLLAAKDAQGTPGLWMALQEGHAEAIQAYGALLQLVPENERAALVDLLAAKDANGTSGLHIALKEGHAEAVKEFGALLEKLFPLVPKIEQGKLLDLLVANNANGTSGLHIALKKGQAQAIGAYQNLLRGLLHLISITERHKLVDLLVAKNSKGTSGLCMALQEGATKAIQAYDELFGEIVQMLDTRERGNLLDLLAVKNSAGTSGLFTALLKNHAGAIEAYGALIGKLCYLIPKGEHGKLIDLLTASHAKGVPGLFAALEKGNTEAVKAYGTLLGKLLHLVPEDEHGKLIKLLTAKHTDGRPALYVALQKGNAEAIEAFGKLLEVIVPFISENERSKLIDLLAAKNKDGVSGLYMALQDGHVGAIRAYGTLLQKLLQLKLIPEDVRDKLLHTLISRDKNGTPGLFMAFLKGNTEAIQAYGELLQLFSEDERGRVLGLLGTIDIQNTPLLYQLLSKKDTAVIAAHEKFVEWIAKWNSDVGTKK